MMNLVRLAVFFLLLAFSLLSANAQDPRKAIEKYDNDYYHPEFFGLRALAFDVRISNLSSILTESKLVGKISDAYYRVHWSFPDKYRIEVMGLPHGFDQIKAWLIEIIRPRLDFVIPERLTSKLKNYKLKLSKQGMGYSVVATDESHMRDVSRMIFNFEKSGKLRQVTTNSPSGTNIASMKMSKKPWSQDKWLVDTMAVTLITGTQKVKMDYKISYERIQGHQMGFPKVVKLVSRQELGVNKSDKEEENSRIMEQTFTFSDYWVNPKRDKKKQKEMK